MQTKTSNAPSPSPFPFSHHGQASNSRACPWVRKGEGGRGWGIVFAAHTQWAAPVGSGREQKIGEHSGIFFVNLISTTVRHPVDYKHTEDWVCGNPKQRVLCKQKTIAPSPSPFPFSHHGQASNSRACPWVRKGEGGRGWGIVFAAHTQWAAPVGSGREQKIGEHSGIFLSI